MKRKDYEKPAMRVGLIQQHAHLLAGSGFGAGRTNYGIANDGVDSKELDGDGNWSWN